MKNKAWTMTPSQDLSGVQSTEYTAPEPGPGQARLRLKAASLNFRDVIISTGQYPFPVKENPIILSDAAWEVESVGEGVTRVTPGDRVINIFMEDWLAGDLDVNLAASAYGAALDGVASLERTLPEKALVRLPESLSFEEGSTLACAGVTAWSALFDGPSRFLPGQTVLTLGTGGVSLFALQLAKTAGAKVIITSSSDEKLSRARELGADVGINYETHPNWEKQVREATGGRGVDVVIETAGPGTLEKSVESLRPGGRVAFIGVLSNPFATISPLKMFQAGVTFQPVFVGNRAHTEALVRVLDVGGVQPVIDRRFGFDEVNRALLSMTEATHFGKIVITT